MIDPSQISLTGESADDLNLIVPVPRVRMIYDTVPDVLPLSPDGAAALSMAVECFADDLLKQALAHSPGGEITYDTLSAFIRENDELSWLHEFVPERKPFSEVLKIIHSNQ